MISIEDPVEHVIPGISQLEVNSKADISFAALLRNSLRQNPDIICIGEIRDPETAAIAVQTAQTGHLIIATLHSKDNLGTIDRLTNLGIPPRSLAATMQVLISQRLIRLLCPHCKKQITLSPEQSDLFKRYHFHPDAVYAPGDGCPECSGTGYQGRMALFDVLVMDPALRSILESQNVTLSAVSDYVQTMPNAKGISEQALALAAEGKTSLAEFERLSTNP